MSSTYPSDSFIPDLNTDNGQYILHQLNSFLRGEIAATDLYRMAIDTIANHEFPAVSLNIDFLRQMQREHGLAAQALRQRIRELGGDPADSAGPHGAWKKIMQGAADFLGDRAGLTALKEGEKNGLADYRDHCSSLDAVSAQLVCEDLLPGQQRHIDVLDQLIAAQTPDA